MTDRRQFESWYEALHVQAVAHPAYAAFVNRQAGRADALRVMRLVCKTHLRSPQILGFLYAIVPPGSRQRLEHNLLEELGHEHEGDPSHPELLRRLGTAIGLAASEWQTLEESAEQVLCSKATEPLMFGTLVENGLNVMLEVFAFEWLLSRESRRIGEALRHYLGLTEHDLEWFYHHSEVDIAHAEQGLDTLVDYTTHYRLDAETVRTIADITFRDNIFLKRYFDLQVEANLDSAATS